MEGAGGIVCCINIWKLRVWLGCYGGWEREFRRYVPFSLGFFIMIVELVLFHAVGHLYSWAISVSSS